MKVMVRRDTRGLSIYVPKKDLEEPVIAQQHDCLLYTSPSPRD